MRIPMTPQERAKAYASAFPTFPPLRFDDRWLDGSWIMGNDYRGSGYYGSYPPGYLHRIAALFPDVITGRVLHLFSGSLPYNCPVPGIRIDITYARMPTVVADAHALPFHDGTFDLVVADPPYSAEDAEHYGTPMINRHAVMSEVARVTAVGGQLVWLDTVLPMFRKAEWHWYIAIGMWRSTNHRLRGVMGFQRVED